GQDLRLSSEPFAPSPFKLEISVEGVRVPEALDVTASTGVTIPVPGSAGAGGGLEGLNAQTEEVAQAVSRVEAGDSTADDHGVDSGRTRHAVSPLLLLVTQQPSALYCMVIDLSTT